MPLPWAKSNRSQASVGSSPDQSSSIPSVLQPQQPDLDAQRYQRYPPQEQKELQPRPYGPGRSPSQRHSSTISLDRPVVVAEGSNPLERPNDPAYAYKQREEKKSLRSKIFGPSSRDSIDNTRGLGRRTSVRRSDNGERYSGVEESHRLQAQQWAQRQGSSSNLAPSREEDESNLDPFLQQHDEQQSPQGPPSEPPYNQVQQYQQYHDQYQRPTLARVNTDQSYPAQGGLEHYSPDQHGGQPQLQQQQPQQYIAYSHQDLHPNPHQQYQAFVPPPAATSPHPLGPPPQYQPPADQQAFAQHPQQLPDGQQVQPAPSPSQGHPQDFQHQRPPSQQQQVPELHHPQPSHSGQPQQQPSQDPQNLQTLRPSSAQLGPPSPGGQQYQAYDPQNPNFPNQTGQQQQQGSTTMPSGSQHRPSLRSGDLGKGGALSRENSMQQSQQMQGQMQPPTPGLGGFGGNVAQQSQSQPYRSSDRKAAQMQEGETGRATPPPNRAVSDMSEEEMHTLIKEHEVLREKYQKVKRYFFDQQSQVHQLQNTLANQRLSLSRTSLDDSQYAARFKRLDGLIADLALSIRKNWKSIPPWLQPGVNKEAIATGGKEMIVAGRAFLSYWLVEEVFEKYFHPDLEVSLSSQLKSIQQNIRRFAPQANNSEEEEALMSKIGNWRLATLEGLSEQLHSPQTSANRQRLIELLNEKLIASLEMYLQEPSPPELSGGVPMIIELAVGILMHLPLESRDVLIEYYPPGHWIQPEFMNIESGITALTNPCSESGQQDAADKASMESVDSKDNASSDQDPSQSGKGDDAKRGARGGMFGGLMANKKPPGQQGKVSTGSGSGSQTSLPQQPPGSASGPKDDQQQRVRMAAGVSVRIRHRSVLAKAPVYVIP